MNENNTIVVRIERRTLETPEIVCIEFRLPDGSPLPAFDAGAHIDVHVAPGIVRQYSLCNPPSERDRYVIGVLRDPASRGGSIAIHDGFAEGALVEIGLPRNHFPMSPGVGVHLMAGGIGVTPLLCMAEALQAQGRDFIMHYCTRSESGTAFLNRIRQAPFASRVVFHFDDGEPSGQLDIDAEFSRMGDDEIYVCGPSGFIDWVCAAAERAGIPKHRVRFEYFSAKPVDTSHDGAFDVRIASTGQTFHVPADRSVVAVLADEGIDIYTSCGEGTCGTCLTRVLEGQVEHRDVFLTDDEHAAGEMFTPCCSRARSSLLVLDL
ncbi:Vanillate O-demethylase oxidoreductase [Burkholderia paludis]|uniref:PDR/VanB family oxidoreductase n=1 Tax=Burkholderia paludis TaxID=1506587 RepID=UPI0004DB79E5|nr:PDR/VanB family oxidoreductase [Burkholderia paludis]KFG93518.1 Vanillate O-demethylase oxidoreductase [Burkholderia paludis]